MCDMEILLDECGDLGGNVSGCSSDPMCYRSFFYSFLSLSLFQPVRFSLLALYLFFFLMPFCLTQS